MTDRRLTTGLMNQLQKREVHLRGQKQLYLSSPPRVDQIAHDSGSGEGVAPAPQLPPLMR